MRQFAPFAALCCLLSSGSSRAAENWFLPCPPQADTILLLRFDGAGATEPNAAPGAGADALTASLADGAQRAPGRFGGGVSLSGQPKQLVRVDDPEKRLSFGVNEAFTAELWCRPRSGETAGLMSLGTRYYLKITPGEHNASFGYRAASFPIRWFQLSNVPIRLRQWNHVALVHGADRVVRLYIDGALAGSVSHEDEGDYDKGGNVTFGAHDGWRYFFSGELDEIRVSRGAREYQPFLTQAAYVADEPVRINVDARRLPPPIARVEVAIFANANERARRVLAREQIGAALTPASQLGDGARRLVARFLDAAGNETSSVEASFDSYGAAAKELARRRDALAATIERFANAPDTSARRDVAQLQLKAINAQLAARQFKEAESRLAAAERVAQSLESGEAAYRGQLRAAVRRGKPKNDVRLTMSWSALAEDAPKAFEWARRLGANELVGHLGRATTEGIRIWKQAGYRTAALTGDIIHNAARVQERPEEAQLGYWANDPVAASGPTLTMKLQSTAWGGEKISYRYDPKQHWRVLDVTADEFLAPELWSVDPKSNQLTIARATPGHRYQAFFMIQTTRMGDPLLASYADATLADFERALAPYKGVLDTLWYDDLGFAYPGPTPQGAWDWESYTLAARPERIAQFERETGVAFDPRWLVMPPRTIEVAPRAEYLRWQEFVQRQMAPWLKRAADATRKHVDRAWLYWGDCHVGIEPYLGALAAGGIDEIDKPAADAVTARALVDFPGDAYRRLRVNWLHGHLVAADRTSGLFMRQWAACKRGLLMKPARGLYWMPFPNVAAYPEESVREDLVETLAEINDEFRLIGEQLGGAEAFKHDIDVCVVHSWGKQYSWRPWGAPILAHLTDLPVRVRFVSYEEVEQGGVPDGADVLYCYGLPGSAWSGGAWWESDRLRAAFEKFVQGGGGLIALQAPSVYGAPKPRMELANALGIQEIGAVAGGAAMTDQSAVADAAQTAGELAETAAAAGQRRKGEDGPPVLAQTARGSAHWLTRESPQQIASLVDSVQATLRTNDAELLYERRGAGGAASVGVAARQFGKGRCVYLAGNSDAPAFSRLICRAVFWAARREADFDKLHAVAAATAGAEQPVALVSAYAYPERQRVALMNAGDAAVDCRLRLDPALFGLPASAPFLLRDVVTGETAFAGAIPAAGAALRLAPNCVRLFEFAAAR